MQPGVMFTCKDHAIEIYDQFSTYLKLHSLVKDNMYVMNHKNGVMVMSRTAFIRKFLFSKAKFAYKIIFAALLIFRIRKYDLYGEYMDQTNDNAFQIFSTLLLKKEQKNIYFITTQSSIDKTCNQKVKKHLVVRNSMEYMVLLFFSKRWITSWNLHDSIVSNHPVIKYFYPLLSNNWYFVPHGVSFDKDSIYLSRSCYSMPKCTLVSSELEKDFFINECGYDNVEVIGYPRMDKFSPSESNKTVLFFTWRVSNNTYVTYIESIVSQLTNDDLVYVFHPATPLEDINSITIKLTNISKNIEFVKPEDSPAFNHAINTSNLLITDYSSLAYDFFIKTVLLFISKIHCL